VAENDARDRPEEEEEDGGDPTREEESEVRVGDLVVVPYARAREQVGCGTEVGVVVEDRRSVMKVLFPGIDRTFWLDRNLLRSVETGRLPTHPWAERLHRIASLVGVDLIEEYDTTGGAAVFHVFVRGMDLGDLVRLREALGADVDRFRVEPGGMRRLRLNVSFPLA
jgi:hypothetical protein